MSKEDQRYKKTYPVSWEQLHRDPKALAWRLVGQGSFEGIIIITRGGLVPAAIIARELGIRLLDTVCVSSCSTHNRQTITRIGFTSLTVRKAAVQIDGIEFSDVLMIS